MSEDRRKQEEKKREIEQREKEEANRRAAAKRPAKRIVTFHRYTSAPRSVQLRILATEVERTPGTKASRAAEADAARRQETRDYLERGRLIQRVLDSRKDKRAASRRELAAAVREGAASPQTTCTRHTS